MLTLLLLRHAKSGWDDPLLEDHERPLSKRGTKAAGEIGSFVGRSHLEPDLILSSDSVRTRATVALLLGAIGGEAREIVYSHDLYLAAPATLLDAIRRVKGRPKRLMVVGHNPGIHALALSLVGGGDAKGLKQMAMKYPTAALSVIEFDAQGWGEVRPGGGTLVSFVTPETRG